MSVSPQVISPGEGRTVTVLGGDVITFKVTADETGGACSIFETITPPGGGPPPHVHQREDETFYVLAGEFHFQIGGASTIARAGTTLVAPRGVPHSFRNAGTVPGKLLVIISPGGFERFIEEFSQLPTNATAGHGKAGCYRPEARGEIPRGWQFDQPIAASPSQAVQVAIVAGHVLA